MLRNVKIQPRIHAVCKFDEIVEASKILAVRKNIGNIYMVTLIRNHINGL